MPTPSVYLDECVDVKLAEALQERGFTVVTTLAASMLGATDDDQLLHAGTHDLMIVTHNRRHFRRLHHLFQDEGRSHGGIILLSRTTPLTRLTVRVAIQASSIATLEDYHNRLFTWGSLQDLLDGGYRLSGYSEEDMRFAIGR